MNDAFLLLTPLLMLPIVALLGFVGCDRVFGLVHVPDANPGPTNFTATAQDGAVALSWDAYANASEYHIHRGLTSGDYAIPPTPVNATSQPSYSDTDVMNGTTYYYVVTATVADVESQNSDEAFATPIATTVDFVTAFTVTTPQNNFTGWAGMEFTVGSQPLEVKALGRVHAAGNVHTHTIKIVDKATITDLAAVTLDTTGGADGQMQTAPLANPANLSPNTTYYLISQETSSESLYMDDSTIQTTGVATVMNAISGDGVTFFKGTPGYHSFGPLTFEYSVIP